MCKRYNIYGKVKNFSESVKFWPFDSLYKCKRKNIQEVCYEKGNIFNREPRRERKLLMHKRELVKLCGLVSQKGYTLIPLSLYFSGKNVKVEIGLCRGKKLYDKRDALAEKQTNREMDRRFKEKQYTD